MISARRPKPPAARRAAAMALAVVLPAAAAAPVELRIVGSDGAPLADAVVFLESPAARAALRPAAGAEIGQAGKQFVPRVSVVPVGTEVRFPNRDTVRHHVYSFSPARTFELKLYAGTPASPVLFDRPGIAVLGCNIHDRMAAWVVVVETPYHTVTGADGRAVLDAPAGAYRLRSWHPALLPGAAALDQPLLLAAGGTAATVRLALPAAAR